ncbi:hypothetical protein C0991_006656, partial [Blastosporella zonata]
MSNPADNSREFYRLLYTSRGEWLLPDSANPLHGWDMSLVFAYGERHGLHKADAYGCLFFYLKNELSVFAKRLRECRIKLTLTMGDATLIPKAITAGTLDRFSPGCFDRIETSNLADYVSSSRILKDWSSLLNRNNQFAAILINFMNWQKRYPVILDIKGLGKQALSNYAFVMVSILAAKCEELTCVAHQGIDVQKMRITEGMNSTSPTMMRFITGISTFMNDHKMFMSFLRDQNIEHDAILCDLKLRSINQVHPKRAGASLDSSSLAIPSKLTKSEFYNT